MYMTTFGPFRTEPSEVVHAQDTFSVFVSAVWSMSTEAPLVPRAFFLLFAWINMKESALFIGASIEF